VGTIIVVEDEPDLREEIVAYLTLSGLDAEGVGSAAELYRRMAVSHVDILVLDLRLPDEHGLSIASYVRANSATGIIMVTAQNEPEDRLRGREAGADVYMSKPVELAELVAAIRTLSARLEGETRDNIASGSGQDWLLDLGRFTLTTPDGREAHVTANELALLHRMASPWGVTVKRGALLEQLGYDAADPSNRNLDAALRRIRLKVKAETGRSLPLRTVHAVGYVMQEPVRVVGNPPE